MKCPYCRQVSLDGIENILRQRIDYHSRVGRDLRELPVSPEEYEAAELVAGKMFKGEAGDLYLMGVKLVKVPE